MHAFIAAGKTAGCQFLQGAARTVDSETNENSKRFKSNLETMSLVGRVAFGVLGLSCLTCAAASLIAVKATSLSICLLGLYFSFNGYKMHENLPSLYNHEAEIALGLERGNTFCGIPKVKKCLLKNTFHFELFYDLLVYLESK